MNVLNNGGGLVGGITGRSTMGDMAQVAQTIAELSGATGRCSENTPVTRYDIQQLKELMAKDQEIAILKSEQNTEVKMADVYERLATRMNANEREQQNWNAQQMVNNAQMSAAIAANATSIAGLQNCCSQITKLVVPNTAICPGWGPVTITPTAPATTVV